MFKNHSLKRFKKLDHMYRVAHDNLNKEGVRAFVIEWANNFKRLDRFVSQREEYESGIYEDSYPIMLANAINDCLDYQSTHIYAQNQSVAAMISDLEDEFTEKLFYLADNNGFTGNDEYHALKFLVKEQLLCYVIEYLDSLSESLR